MRILFCDSGFPGQFEGLARYFAARPEHAVLFASSYGRRDFSIAGLRRILLRTSHERASRARDEFVRQLTRTITAGREARGSFARLKETGFEPDMVVFSAGCGESLFLKDIFPAAFRAVYLDPDWRAPAGGDDEKSAFAAMTRGAALFQGHAVFSLSGDERGVPAFLRPVVGMAPPCVDTDFFRPESAGPFVCDGLSFSRESAELVSIDLKGMSRKTLLAAVAARLLRERPNCHVLLLDQAGAESGAQAALAQGCGSRLHARAMTGRDEYRNMLAASTIHVSPSPRSRMRELMEALSCGALLLARPPSAASGPLIAGKTMLAWPDAAADQLRLLHHVLDNRDKRNTLCRNGQEAVWTRHARKIIVPRHAEELLKAYEDWKTSGLSM